MVVGSLPKKAQLQEEIFAQYALMQNEKLKLDSNLSFIESISLDSDFLGADKKSFLHWAKIFVEKVMVYLDVYHDSWFKLMWARLVHIKASGIEKKSKN